MKKINLTHPYSPQILIDLGHEIEGVIDADELDDKRLLSLIEQRDIAINEYLEQVPLSEKRIFIEHEIRVNDALTSVTRSHFSDSLNELSSMVRGRKAVQKYQL